MVATKSATMPLAQSSGAAAWPGISGNYAADVRAFSHYWRDALAKLDGLPARRDRSDEQKAAAIAIMEDARKSRARFLSAHAVRLYRELTNDLGRFRRVEDLAYAAAEAVPGLCPTKNRVAGESTLVQADKDGHEVDQGLFFNAVLADRECGLHLCHAMLLPRKEAVDRLEQLRKEGRVELEHAAVERQGKASFVYLKNSRYLNAEDDTTVADVETAVDLALLDPETSVCVLRGGKIENGKHAGQHVFCTGINLTHIYYGRLSYLWYLIRDLGFINKFYRGLATPDAPPDEMIGDSIEKPWIAAIDKFAIGGGCQYILSTDYNIAGKDAYMTLPARKEGIIPGVANMRMPRFVGDRASRQAIMADMRIDCDSHTGRQICDLIVEPDAMDAAIHDTVDRLTNSGVVSASGNRRAMRIAAEPLDLFRTYMAVYAREQAYCHFSPALINNLERFWNAQSRKV
ncbi:enoyl-CoA hydratase/isomerase family protein [Bradyrhizobium japonicum]|uniref:enoyl-CoA hydratase/isomerase family protein n=1 Tax=Bradyrhizobium japonicum TaxID=375 RepID=UPI001BAC3C5A|nr:enoyl-CoA hydratase/isomerase family protein [Bradyrhizobium japonicum]MBR0766532.1 enoyl-CoA hydratase/isomerase family protein [Bradyrhizobium japonicum]